MEIVKVFISQPMRGKTTEQVRAERAEILKDVAKYLEGKSFEVLNTIFDEEPGKTYNHFPLFYLSKSIQVLGTADYAYFANGWENYNGCCIEHECCTRYGIAIIKD